MNIKTIILALILTAIFSGCIDNKGITKDETYISPVNATFTLHPDGTFESKSRSGMIYSGVYRIDGEKLSLIFDFAGITYKFTKSGDDYDGDGAIWKHGNP